MGISDKSKARALIKKEEKLSSDVKSRVVEALREIRLNKRVSGRLFFLDLWLLCRWFCLFLELCRLFEVFLFVR